MASDGLTTSGLMTSSAGYAGHDPVVLLAISAIGSFDNGAHATVKLTGDVSFIRMRAEDTFDGQDRVMSRAAYDLHIRATSCSAFCGHPGLVPGQYLVAAACESS